MTMRRAPGEGSIYQRADGKWEGSVAAGRTPSGKRRRLKVTASTRRELGERLSTLRREVEAGLTTDATRLTVGEWLQRWLQDEVRGSVRPRTYEGYEAAVRCHLLPGLGHFRLRRLTAADVKAFMQRQLASGLTPDSVRNQHSILRRALEIAMRYDYTQRNVARLVSPPRLLRTEIHPLDREETLRVFAAARGHRLEALFVLAASTGMRLGEVLGLSWDAVDLDGGFVRVERILARYDRAYHLDPPKTARSRRAIAIPGPVVAALRSRRAIQEERAWALGPAWGGREWNLVFTTEKGHPLSPRTVQEIFARLLDEAGVRRVRFHDLRHGAATFLLAQGVAMKVVQDVLGHAQIAMTADLYSHVVPELRRDAADRIGATLFGGEHPEAVFPLPSP